MTEPSTFIAAAVAFATCLALVPLAKRFARSVGLVDKPDRQRKLHAKAIPLAGGIAIYFALIIAVVVAGSLARFAGEADWFNLQNYIGILLGGTLILGIGVLDDRFGMKGRTKLAGQFLAVCVFLLFGKGAYEIDFVGIHFPMWASMTIICIWLLGTINAVNLIDGADGMASTVGAIGAATLAVMAFMMTRSAEAVIAAGLAAAILAFLIYNFPPASVFLGDAGSMFIGFLIGTIAINASSKEAASIMMVAPAAVIIIPLFDSFVAILRRRLTGRSIYTVDRGHIHHALMARGYGPRQMLLLVALLSVISAIGGALGAVYHSDLPALASVSFVVLFLVLGRVFGFAEFALLRSKLFALGRSFITTPDELGLRAQQQTIRLQGSRNWDQLWQAVTQFAEKHTLAQVRLDLNLPWLHEGYHATWQRPVKVDKHDCWKTSLPLNANGRTFGRLEIIGPLGSESVYVLLNQLSDLLEAMEPVVLRLANEEIRPSSTTEEPAPLVVTSLETETDSAPTSTETIDDGSSDAVEERRKKPHKPVGSNV